MDSAEKDSVAGSVDSNGYVVVSVNNKGHYAHKIIWEMHSGEIPNGYEVDHIDRNRANNNLNNLRIVTRKQNSQNHNMRDDNTTGVTGVYLTKNKTCSYWSANCSVGGKILKKHFSIDKLGFEEAKRMAIACRESMIRSLNNQGCNYTTTHGEKV